MREKSKKISNTTSMIIIFFVMLLCLAVTMIWGDVTTIKNDMESTTDAIGIQSSLALKNYTESCVDLSESNTALLSKKMDNLESMRDTFVDACRNEYVDCSYFCTYNLDESKINYHLLCNSDGDLDVETIDETIEDINDIFDAAATYDYENDEIGVIVNKTSKGDVYSFIRPVGKAVTYKNGRVYYPNFVGVDILVDKMKVSLLKAILRDILSCFAFLFIFSLVVSYFFRKNIERPLRMILSGIKTYDVEKISEYRDITLDEDPEFSVIADSFNRSVKDTKEYIENVKRLTIKQASTETQLNAASQIQMGMLPSIDHSDSQISVKGFIRPASYVGGDFYDYLEIDKDRFMFLIADVSGKGMGAAVFMARAITVIRDYTMMGLSPASILEKANNALIRNNPESYFVTCFLCIYSRSEKTIRYANAGHNLPYMVSGNVTELDGNAGCPLGLFDGETYINYNMGIHEGDRVFLYTDGINEAENKNDEFFGNERLKQVLKEAGQEDDLIELVCKAVSAFTNGAAQYDDMTMLSFEVKKSESMTDRGICRIRVPAVLSSLDDIIQACRMVSENRLETSDNYQYLMIAIEEWFANICTHAYEGRQGMVDFEAQILDHDVLRCTFKDEGIPFNPVTFDSDKNSEDSINLLLIGGHGISMIKKMTDRQDYKYENGSNYFSFEKQL